MPQPRQALRRVRATLIGFAMVSLACGCGTAADTTPSTRTSGDESSTARASASSTVDTSCLADRHDPCPNAVALPTCPKGHADGVHSVDGVLADPPHISGGGMILRGRLAVDPVLRCTEVACQQACCNTCTSSVVFEGTVPGRHADLVGRGDLACAGDESRVCCGVEVPAGEVIVTADIGTQGDHVWFENPVICKL